MYILCKKKIFFVHRLTCHSVRAMLPSIVHIFHSIFHIQSSIFCSLSFDWGKSILLGILPLLLTLPSLQKMFLGFFNCLLFTDWLNVSSSSEMYSLCMSNNLRCFSYYCSIAALHGRFVLIVYKLEFCHIFASF